MDELATNLTALQIGRRIHVGFADEDIPDEVPFRPSGNLATKLHDVPRYLFRVYSYKSAGENSSEWMKSIDALENHFTDIFARDNASIVALTLNEHLRWWSKSKGDPFISWTTSLLVAIQYAIYKHKKEAANLNTIYLCIVDTTLFPNGVFMKDLYLMEEFQYQDKDSGDRDLSDFRQLRKREHRTYSGVYYFGEYLSQGQTNISGRSCTVPCDKIINNHLFAMMPQFEAEMEGETLSWADAVIKIREPFYVTEQEAIHNSEFYEAMAIASEFDTRWILPMLANLLALSPRTARDPANIGLISNIFSDEEKLSLSSKTKKVVANDVGDNIPEVRRFEEIVRDINEDYYAKSVAALVRSMKETADVARRFIRDFRTTGGREMLGTGNLAGCLPTVDLDYVQPLIQSLETLSGIMQESQEATT
ncbi:hypothetical protein ACHAQJ_003165 [Trichoderma viride]